MNQEIPEPLRWMFELPPKEMLALAEKIKEVITPGEGTSYEAWWAACFVLVEMNRRGVSIDRRQISNLDAIYFARGGEPLGFFNGVIELNHRLNTEHVDINQ